MYSKQTLLDKKSFNNYIVFSEMENFLYFYGVPLAKTFIKVSY